MCRGGDADAAGEWNLSFERGEKHLLLFTFKLWNNQQPLNGAAVGGAGGGTQPSAASPTHSHDLHDYLPRGCVPHALIPLFLKPSL